MRNDRTTNNDVISKSLQTRNRVQNFRNLIDFSENNVNYSLRIVLSSLIQVSLFMGNSIVKAIFEASALIVVFSKMIQHRADTFLWKIVKVQTCVKA